MQFSCSSRDPYFVTLPRLPWEASCEHLSSGLPRNRLAARSYRSVYLTVNNYSSTHRCITITFVYTFVWLMTPPWVPRNVLASAKWCPVTPEAYNARSTLHGQIMSRSSRAIFLRHIYNRISSGERFARGEEKKFEYILSVADLTGDRNRYDFPDEFQSVAPLDTWKRPLCFVRFSDRKSAAIYTCEKNWSARDRIF